MLGAIAEEDFLATAKYYMAGDRVHWNFTIRPGHEIFNIEIVHLVALDKWLDYTLTKDSGDLL